jgi:hypothetical protein
MFSSDVSHALPIHNTRLEVFVSSIYIHPVPLLGRTIMGALVS